MSGLPLVAMTINHCKEFKNGVTSKNDIAFEHDDVVNTKKIKSSFKHDDIVNTCAFSPDK